MHGEGGPGRGAAALRGSGEGKRGHGSGQGSLGEGQPVLGWAGWRAGLRRLQERAFGMPVAALLMGCRGRLSVSYPPCGAWRREDLVTPWVWDRARPPRPGQRSWRGNSETSAPTESLGGLSWLGRNPHAGHETDGAWAVGGRDPGRSEKSDRSHAILRATGRKRSDQKPRYNLPFFLKKKYPGGEDDRLGSAGPAAGEGVGGWRGWRAKLCLWRSI